METGESLTKAYKGAVIEEFRVDRRRDVIEMDVIKDGEPKTLLVTVKYSSPRIIEKEVVEDESREK